MPGGPGTDRIGKQGNPVLNGRSDVLDLQIAGRPRSLVEEKVQPAFHRFHAHFPLDLAVARQFRDPVLREGLGHKGVGPAGMDTHDGAAPGFDEFPCVRDTCGWVSRNDSTTRGHQHGRSPTSRRYWDNAP